MVQYHDILLRLRDTHPSVNEELKGGCFSIRKTRKPFSGSPIDLTLEQTMNVDTANQKVGISYHTNPVSARERWASNLNDNRCT